MGRLIKRHQPTKKAVYVLLAFGLALLIVAVCIFLLLKSTQKSAFHDHILTNTVPVGTQYITGHQQVYYEYKGKRIFVTKEKGNRIGPKASGPYVAWQEESGGQSQVMLHDLRNETSLQLSLFGTNTSISMDGNLVAWQGLSGNSWAIYFFDGTNVKKASQNYPSIRPFVQGGQILFAQQINQKSDTWQTVRYDVTTGKHDIIRQGTAAQASFPRYENGEIKTDIIESSQYN